MIENLCELTDNEIFSETKDGKGILVFESASGDYSRDITYNSISGMNFGIYFRSSGKEQSCNVNNNTFSDCNVDMKIAPFCR